MDPSTVAVIAYQRIRPFHLGIPCAVFGEERPGLPRWRFRLCAAEPGPLRTQAGFTIETPWGLSQLSRAQVIIIPGWRDPEERPPEPLLEALRRAHKRGAILMGLCLGAFVLAEAGLLDGLRATTHWSCAELFARRFPDVRLDSEVLYVDEGNLITSAGAAAGLDCCLHLVRRQCGAEVAASLARRLVVAPHREGGQAQFIQAPMPPEVEAFSKVLDWARGHLHKPLDLDLLAKRAHMSRRTFTRQFRSAVGTSPLQWLLSQRLARAQALLETTALSMDRVAEAVGLGQAASLRQHFQAAFGIAPSRYRALFRGQNLKNT